MGRFSRNDDTFNISEQDTLWKSTAVICGCGGGGGVIAELLVRMGIGNLILIDGDSFEESNLNRQIASKSYNLYKEKVRCLKQHLSEINQACNIKAIAEFITKDNYESLLKEVLQKPNTVLIDCVDGYTNKKMLEDIARDLEISYISGGNGIGSCSVITVSAQAKSSWLKEPAPKLKECHPEPTLVWIQASMQAQHAVNFLLNRNNNFDKLFTYNMHLHTCCVCNTEDLI